jgi:hypothetical protein
MSASAVRPKFDWKFRIEVEAVEIDYLAHVATIHVPEHMSPEPDRVIEIFLWLDPALQRIDVFAGGKPSLCHQREGDGWVTCHLSYAAARNN